MMFAPANEFNEPANCPSPLTGLDLFASYPQHDRIPFTWAQTVLNAVDAPQTPSALAMLHTLVSEGSSLRDDAALLGAEQALRCGAVALASWFLAALEVVPQVLEPRRMAVAAALANAPYLPPPIANDPVAAEIVTRLEGQSDVGGPVWVYGDLAALLVVRRPGRAWRFALPGTTLEANLRRYRGRRLGMAMIALPLPDPAMHEAYLGTVAAFGVPVITITTAPAPERAGSLRLEQTTVLAANPSFAIARWVA